MRGPIAALFRLVRAGWVMLREGIPRIADPALLPASGRLALRIARLFEKHGAAKVPSATRLSDALNRLGPSYVKLGQFLATRPDVVGADIASDLEALQDRLDPFPESLARERIEENLGRPVEALFDHFGPAVAAASIAQVHHAAVREADGSVRPVAVKILRPGIKRRFANDLESFYLAARLGERLIPSLRRLRPVAVLDTLARSVAIEMDLRMEAAALSEMGENTRNDPGFRVPAVDWARTGREVLTLEWVDGIKLNDRERLLQAGHDLQAIAATLVQSFLRQAVRDGFFHADMHPGNLFVDENGNIVAVDLGITARLGKQERRFLAEILYGFIRRDYRRVAEVHFEAGYVPETYEVDVFAQSLRAIGEPLQGRRADEISMGRVLQQLFENTALFEMRTQPQLVLLQKTMVVVEGVARMLDPHLDMWRTAEPVLREWVELHLGPAARLQEAGESLGTLARFAANLPELAERAERISRGLVVLSRDGVQLHEQTIRRLAAEDARRARLSRFVMVVMALVLILIAVRLW